MKKVLSLVLVIAMVLSSMSFAFAGTFEDVADSNYESAINTLVGLGIVTGYEDGTYRPEKTVTRAEMAKLMVVTLGYGDLVAGAKSNFSDTQGHWADAYIALAAGKGLVVGTGEGKFTPDRTVSYDEALTMMVRALGYTDTCNEIKGTWPSNFKIKAAELGMTKNVVMSTTGADRGGVAQLIFNALESTLVSVDSDGNVTYLKDTDNAQKILLGRIAEKKSITVNTDMLDKDSKKYVGDKVDLKPYLYQSIETYVIYTDKTRDYYDVVYVRKSNDITVTGEVTDVLNSAKVSVYKDGAAQVAANQTAYLVVEDANEDEHIVTIPGTTGAAVTVYYNGKEGTITTDQLKAKLADNTGAQVTVVVNDLNDNGKVNDYETVYAMVATKATKGIQVKNDYRTGKLKIDGLVGSIALPNSDNEVSLSKLTVSGAVDSLEDIVADDIVVAYYSLDEKRVDLVVSKETLSGKVTKTNTAEDTVYIDGTKYYISEVVNTVGSLEVASEGTFYLDNFGDVFAFDGSALAPSDYAVVIGAANGTVSGNFGYSVDKYPEIKLATQNNEIVVYKVQVELDSTDGEADSSATIIPYGNTTSQSIVTGNSTVSINITSKLPNTRGQLVKYSLDEDGYIDAIEIVATAAQVAAGNTTVLADDVESMVSENTVVFNGDVTPGPTSDYEVIKAANVKNGNAYVVLATEGNNKGKAEVIVACEVTSVNDGTYGIIKSVNYVTNAAGKKVKEVTAFIDGEEVTYLSTTGVTGTVAKTTTNQAIKFSFNTSDVITDVTDAVDSGNFMEFKGTVSGLTNYGMSIDGTTRFFAKDCVVYIYDQSEKTWSVGDVTDIDDDANIVTGTAAYVVDNSESTNFNIIVQIVK